MLGNLTIDKASMNISCFLYSVKIIQENAGRITRKEFVKTMAEFIGLPYQKNGKENRTPYNKSKLPRYFGFIDLAKDADGGSILVLTQRGAKLADIISERPNYHGSEDQYYIKAEDQSVFTNMFLESVLFDTFGKNNCGAETSNTDVEPPKVVFKTLALLGRATAAEIVYIMYSLNRGMYSSYDDALNAVKEKRAVDQYDYSTILEEWGLTNIANDCKIINIFTDDSIKLILSERDDVIGKTFYKLNPHTTQHYQREIEQLSPVYAPLQMTIHSSNINTALQWVNETILGRVSNTNCITTFDRSPTTSSTAFIQDVLVPVVARAYNNEKVNHYLIIKNADTEQLAELFGTLAPLLVRETDFTSVDNGFSSKAITDEDAYNKLVALSGIAKVLLKKHEVLLPPNFHIVSIESETVNMSREYDYSFAQCLVDTGAPVTDAVADSIPYAWYVGATGNDENGNGTDFSEQYIAEGRWKNGWDNKFIEAVNSMEVGDRIAIKAAYTKKNGLPFNNHGQVVGVMAIKAIGIITENPKDGKNIKVQWTKVDPVKEWYGAGVLRTTVHRIAASEGYIRKALLDFTFNNVPQDYSLCEEKYLEEDLLPVDVDIQEPIFFPRTHLIHPLNCILYGAPGTGKTYATAEYALAILENREVDTTPKTADERKAVMEKYRSFVADQRIVFTTFHQSYGYEDFIQGLRPVSKNGGMDFVPVDGVFKRIADTALMHPEDNYVIIIDEINRANISKVFGELITLIEDDKRWGEVNALQVTLPSGEFFKIPNNLYIVGTMNSADKSISLIDTALRRRFEFIEVTPNIELISDLTLRSVLEKLNTSLARELDSTDLLVGHAYFINKTADDLCSIFNRSIIPLLYEYFYDNSAKVKAQLKNALPSDQYEITDGKVGRIKISKK